MRRPTFLCFVLLSFILHAYARESIKPGEESGIPERADVQKDMKEVGPKKVKEKKETRQNQETTDPVFYDSTTSPKEMEKQKDEEDF